MTRHSSKESNTRPTASPEVVEPATRAGASMSFEEIYDEHFDYVWRMVRRVGVADASVDDVVQNVFIIVHRKLPSFEGRSKVRTWIYGIVRRVVSDYRRSRSRRNPTAQIDEPLQDFRAQSPAELAERKEANALLHEILSRFDDEKREVFILAEMEQMTAPEIAEATGVKLNTVYSRLRAARASFNQAVARLRAAQREVGV